MCERVKEKNWEKCPTYILISDMIKNPNNPRDYIEYKIDRCDCEYKDLLRKALMERED